MFTGVNKLLGDFQEDYKPHPLHFFVPLSVAEMGMALIKGWGWGADIVLLASVPVLGGSYMMYWMVSADIIKKRTQHELAKRGTVQPNPAHETNPEPAPEPMFPDGLKPFIRVNGVKRPAFAYTTAAVKLDKERHIAVTCLRQHENGFPVDLTEERWARNRTSPNGRVIKKFCSRSELNDIKAKWERHDILYRVSGAKNAKHDVLSWEKLEEVARGRPLPQ